MFDYRSEKYGVYIYILYYIISYYFCTYIYIYIYIYIHLGKLNDQVSGILISISFDTFSNSDGAYHHPENPLPNQATRKLDGGGTESFSQKNVLEIWNSPIQGVLPCNL